MEIRPTAVHRQRFTGPGAWREADAGGPQDWTFRLTPALLTQIERGEFPEAERLRGELLEGRGFLVLKGVPVDDERRARRLYLAIAGFFGASLPQNARGDLLYSVRDEGQSIDREYGQVGVRFSKTTLELDYHTDAGPMFGGGTPDFVGLLCLQTPRSGGLSALVSAETVHNVLLDERPAYLERLYQTYYWDRRAELRPGESPILTAPVLRYDGRLQIRHFPFYIHRAPEVTSVPLTEADVAPLDYLDELTRRPGLAVAMEMEPGDIQLIHNRRILHSRTAYQDHPEPERRRHLVRLWLQAHG